MSFIRCYDTINDLATLPDKPDLLSFICCQSLTPKYHYNNSYNLLTKNGAIDAPFVPSPLNIASV